MNPILPALRIALPLLGGVLLTFACTFSCVAKEKAAALRPQAAASGAEIADKKNDLSALRGQIDALRKEMSAAEGLRADAADQLKEAERDISMTQRSLRQLAEQQTQLNTSLQSLQTQSQTLETQLKAQQNQLQKLIYRQYVQGSADTLQRLLNGKDPNQLARDWYYLGLIAQARSRLLTELGDTLGRLRSLAAERSAQAEQLKHIQAQQKDEQAQLLAQRARHKATLGKIAAKMTRQRQEIGHLQRDEQRLTQLLKRLSEIIANEARAAQKRRSQAASATQPGSAVQGAAKKSAEKSSKATQSVVPTLNNEQLPQPSTQGFARLKGNLRLPVKGSVRNRFGTARQEGSLWKGLFIRAAVGSDVQAIAAGRVVFADWMRGFGNLLIIDHGDAYLSIYGNNDALLKQVGDSVRGGDSIGVAGNSGGSPESGLYFEIRHQGQALDPLSWVSLK
ncbi:MAG: peptidoglycan DD-metalloendopeptidase family protein [Pseudomonadota bacterium]